MKPTVLSNSLQRLISGNVKTLLIVISPLMFWFILVSWYAWSIDASFISRDQWRFLDMVDNYLSGTLDWQDIWSSHSEHVKPGYKLLFLFNAKYLGLNLLVEIFAGLALLAATVVLVLREMATSFNGARSIFVSFTLLTTGVILMSFNQWANYVYSLLALGGFGEMLLQIAFLCGFSRALTSGVTRAGLLWLVVILLLCVWGFSGARSPALIGACVIVTLLAIFLDPGIRSRIWRHALPLIMVGIFAIGIYLVLLDSNRSNGGGLVYRVLDVLDNPLGAIAYIYGMLANSMLNIDAVAWHHAILENILAVLGSAVLIWALWRYFAARHWRVTWVPLLLILYSGIFVLEVLIGRFGSDHSALHGTIVPRYVFDSHLWMVGVAWIIGLDWVAGPARFWRRVPLVSIMTLLLAIEIANLNYTVKLAHYQVRSNAKVTGLLKEIVAGRQTTDVLPRWECPNAKLCAHGMEILKKYHLNVAR
ncbi:MAG TPA: hypothetical protein VFK12_07855 [Gammaproteobacteria bacterium]|nr:hypothetical protein [Gammaproteobacteria bacterium]